jgi:predicted permease
MEFYTTVGQVVVLFILLMTGFMVRRLNIVDDLFSKNLSNFVFNIVFPAMIIYSMNFPFSKKALVDGGWLIVISIGILLFSGIVSIISVKLLKVDTLSENIFHFGLLFSNFSFMGFPVISAVFGEKAIFYTSIFIVPLRLAFNTIGVLIMQRGTREDVKISVKSLINPPIVAVAAGFIIFLFSIQLPSAVNTSIKMVAGTMTPLGLMIVGLNLANAKFAAMFSNYKVYIVSVIRLIVLPICLFVILKAFQFDSLMIGVPVIITAMPIAASASILAEKYDGDSYLGAQSVFISTLLSIVTIPFIALMVT